MILILIVTDLYPINKSLFILQQNGRCADKEHNKTKGKKDRNDCC